MNGFLQIRDATCPQGLAACGRIIKACHEDDRKGRSGCNEPPLQVNTGKADKMNVQKQAIHLLHGASLKKCLGGVKRPNLKAVRIQQKSDGVEGAGIVIDDCDNLSPRWQRNLRYIRLKSGLLGTRDFFRSGRSCQSRQVLRSAPRCRFRQAWGLPSRGRSSPFPNVASGGACSKPSRSAITVSSASD